MRRYGADLLLEAEAVGPGHERPEQQLVIKQDHAQHRDDGPADRPEVARSNGGERDRELRLSGEGEVGSAGGPRTLREIRLASDESSLPSTRAAWALAAAPSHGLTPAGR